MSHLQPTVARWRAGRAHSMLAALSYPIVAAINRPSMMWFSRAVYDFALRANGIAINYKGSHGLTAAEEAFLARIGPGLGTGVVLDVGANSGCYSMELRRLSPRARIIAFEPHPRTFLTAQTRLIAADIEVLQLALSEEVGMMELFDFADADGSTQASLSSESIGLYSQNMVAHPVAVTTLDAFLNDRKIERVAFLKIDTEGHDIRVLAGAKQAIRDKRIDLLQFEFIGANVATRTTMRDFFEALPGYRISRLCLNGQELPLEYSVKRCEIPVNQNLIARPVR